MVLPNCVRTRTQFPLELPGGPLRAEDGELCAVDDDVGVGGGVGAQLEVAGVAVGAEVQRRLAHLAPDAHRVRGEDHLPRTHRNREWLELSFI